MSVKLQILILALFLFFGTLVYGLGPGITTPPSCGFFSWNITDEIPLGTANDLPQFTVFGDSRAKFVSEHGRLGNFSNASKDGKPLILPNQIKKIQNLGWAGSTASDDPMGLVDGITYFMHPSKAREMTWWRRWDACRASGVAYYTHPKVVIDLGGNDMVNFEKYYAGYDGYLEKLTNL